MRMRCNSVNMRCNSVRMRCNSASIRWNNCSQRIRVNQHLTQFPTQPRNQSRSLLSQMS